MKPENANGMKLMLLQSVDGLFFRQYYANGDFRDIDIWHYDLEIEVLDKDAYIYKDKEGWHIDYSSKTLGRK